MKSSRGNVRVYRFSFSHALIRLVIIIAKKQLDEAEMKRTILDTHSH